ncbi:NUDIX hydrolase [Macrococcoides goetzii]|nr:NUDIX hydrolase [Macrococcus goetzii]TDM50942.1 NUDIX hydrolase [Macrococcus goetzii]
MKTWNGASVIVINNNKLLIVKSKSEQKWSIPTGGIEKEETSEEAAIREVFEETGYSITILNHIKTTSKLVKEYKVTVDYFLGVVHSEEMVFNDPDDKIEEIKWITISEYDDIDWMYPEDEIFIKSYLKPGGQYV